MWITSRRPRCTAACSAPHVCSPLRALRISANKVVRGHTRPARALTLSLPCTPLRSPDGPPAAAVSPDAPALNMPSVWNPRPSGTSPNPCPGSGPGPGATQGAPPPWHPLMGSRIRFAAEMTYIHRLDRVWFLFRSRAGGHNTARCLLFSSDTITSTPLGLAALTSTASPHPTLCGTSPPSIHTV
eukprot:gene12914-biopygen4881